MRKFIYLVFLLLPLVPAIAEEKSAPVAEPHTFKINISRQTNIRYQISLPAGYKESDQKWPLIFFLHGGSGRGDDINRVNQYGPPAIAAKHPDYPFIVLSPQCEKGEIWSDTGLLIALLEHVVAQYRIDTKRIYLMGASMGGRGVLYLAYKHPDRFAAVAALCPWATNTDWAQALKDVPMWIFHGDQDKQVHISESEDMVKALKATGNDVKFTILPGRGHDIAEIFEMPALIEWILQQRKSH
jgi:predicted peptidase